MSLALRPNQLEMYERARARLRDGMQRLLLQAPTGFGKTVLVSHMLKNSRAKNCRAWFVVHRRELVKQSIETLALGANLPLGVVAAGFRGNRHELTQVCGVQTLSKRRHLLPDPDLIVWDECHHVAAGSWADIFAAYPKAVHIGLTATPERLDGTGLGKWFEDIITGPPVAQLIAEGWLTQYRLFAPGGPDLSAVHTVAGDYNKKELAMAMAKTAVTGDALTHYLKHARGRRAVVFMWSVESSQQMAQKFQEAGIPAAHLDGKTDDQARDRMIEDFRQGKLLVLTNVEIISEGFDLPAIEAVFLLRPTQSLSLYLQQVGRALRTSPGKTEALIFDHAGNCRTHGLPDDERQWSLQGRVKSKANRDSCPVRQCPKCFAMLSASKNLCKWCGFRFQVQSREMEEIEGELQEIDKEQERHYQRQMRKDEERSCKTLEELIALGKSRNYNNPEGWAGHVMAWREAVKGRYSREAVGAMRGR